jgi:hypothetical protein
MKASENTRRLALVSSESVPVREPERGVLRARPGDRCEPWALNDALLLAGLHTVAVSARIDSSLAATLVVERSLLEIELGNLAPPQTTTRLDARAADAQVEMELTTASADYLRALTCSSTVTSASLDGALKLPMRLSDRILRFGLSQVIQTDLLGSAISWERASVLSGQTMSEWAFSHVGAA